MTVLQDINLFHTTVPAMNSRLDILFWGSSQETNQSALAQIEAETLKLEKAISRHDPEAELYRLNQQAFQQVVKPGARLWHAILAGIKYYKLTGGYFNIFMGALFQAVKQGTVLPDIPKVDITELIAINEEEGTFRFLHPMASIDFGGMGKGMALNTIGAIIETNQIPNAFISFGESSVLTRGRHPHGLWWPFSLAGGFGVDKVWQMTNSAISVSHSYSGGNNSLHIVDPITSKPIGNWSLVLVQAASPEESEVVSTALVAAPADKHRGIIDGFSITDYFVLTNEKTV